MTLDQIADKWRELVGAEAKHVPASTAILFAKKIADMVAAERKTCEASEDRRPG